MNPDLIRNHTKTVILIWILFIIALPAGIMFGFFLFISSFTVVKFHLSERVTLLLDAFLSIIFFLQHSILVRPGIKRGLAKVIPEEYYSAFYGLTSGIALLLLLVFWQKSSTIIASADGIGYWILRGLFCICLVGFFWGNKALGSFDVLGVKRLMRYISKRRDKQQQIMAKGPYSWVRHPLYLFLIIMIWSCPVLTLDRLIFNILWTIWIVLGTYLEDRDLHREFGSHYRAYSARVPMLIPYRIPRKTPL